MSMVCGLDLHRQQITFDTLETGSGEVWRGRVWQPDRDRFRRWLCHDVARRAEGQPVAMAVEGCTGWRYVAEEIVAAGFEVHVAEPADTQTARGKKHRAKTDRSDARLFRELLQRGELPDSHDEQTAEPPRSSSVATAGADAVTATGTTSLASVSTTPPQFETRPSPSTTGRDHASGDADRTCGHLQLRPRGPGSGACRRRRCPVHAGHAEKHRGWMPVLFGTRRHRDEPLVDGTRRTEVDFHGIVREIQPTVAVARRVVVVNGDRHRGQREAGIAEAVESPLDPSGRFGRGRVDRDPLRRRIAPATSSTPEPAGIDSESDVSAANVQRSRMAAPSGR